MTRRNLALLLTLGLCLGVGTGVRAQTAADHSGSAWVIPGTDAIDALLAARTARNAVGIVVGVIEPGGRRVIAHGRSGAPDGRPLDGESIFQIGSVTKVFTGLLLADMATRGDVALDDPASKFLPPGVTMPERGRPITLIDLSKHWSGLPSMPANFTLDAGPNPYEAYTEQQLYQFLSSYQLTREPGTQAYSNLGVALLGRLLARRAGVEYADLLRQRVLEPMSLRSTSIEPAAEQRRRSVPGHDRFLRPVDTWFLKAMPASGSLWSSANDLLTFLSFHLELQESPLRDAMRLQRAPGRALGWGASRVCGETVYGHEGGKEGYRSAAIINMRTRTGAVVLMNARTEESPMALARHLLCRDSPLGPAPSAPAPPRFVTLAPAVLAARAGEYELGSGERLRIVAKGDRLLLGTAGDGVMALSPTSAAHFVATGADARVTFDVDADGRVRGLVLYAGDAPQKAVRVAG